MIGVIVFVSVLGLAILLAIQAVIASCMQKIAAQKGHAQKTLFG